MSKIRSIYQRGDEVLDSLAEKFSAKQAIIVASISLLVAVLCLGTTGGVLATQDECADSSQQ